MRVLPVLGAAFLVATSVAYGQPRGGLTAAVERTVGRANSEVGGASEGATSVQPIAGYRASPGVPWDLVRQAIAHVDAEPARWRRDVVVVVDFRRSSAEKRFFVVDRKAKQVHGYLTSHGRGSDPRRTGRATRFSDEVDSKKTSVGLYRTASPYYGKYGYSLRLDGLSATNRRTRKRAIVVHGARYVNESLGRAGRSWGCFALDPRVRTQVIERIKGGALIYAPDPR